MDDMVRSVSRSLGFGAVLLMALGVGCSSGDGATGTDGGAGSSTGGASTGGASTGGASTGGASTGGASTGGASTGGASTGGSSTGGTSGDPLEAARQACIDHINELRASKGRAPYTRWTAIESCVDDQATYDSTHGPHADFIGGNTCGASSQGECPGSGPQNVTGCIDLMWAEKDQAICSGCDACPSLNDGWNGNCPNCKVQTSSPTCGHYLALVTSAQTTAACGFSSGSAYTAIDYQ
jgi:hypothetical protein